MLELGVGLVWPLEVRCRVVFHVKLGVGLYFMLSWV